MTQDFKLGFRMLLKYPGLTLAGGLALAIAIGVGVGAGWYRLGKHPLSPTIPLHQCSSRLFVAQHRLGFAVTNVFQRAVFAHARRLCLAFPETAETASWSHPNCRAGKKTFCTSAQKIRMSHENVARPRSLHELAENANEFGN